MENEKVKGLCLSLMKADMEEKVIQLLDGAGYWDEPAAWRYYGDRESNFNTIGNQQSRPEAALVEKLVNSVDARLMNECLVRGIDPEGESAPSTIRDAVARFFEDNPNSATAGLVREWPASKRTQVARGTTLTATGVTAHEGNPCFTISDCGEGQTPAMMPDTLLSLDKTNKLRIAFVQGKFNMGGTGALRFCGRHNLQLVLSRRSIAILNGNLSGPSDTQWGFTIVRREDPEGGRRSSVYTYLAPVGMQAQPSKGGVLRFSADTFPIFPEARDAYGRESAWGTLVKLYEYAAGGYRTNILLKGGMMRRVDLLLPDVALPIRVHECRAGFRGHAGSFETTLTGIRVRLEDDKAGNLEPGFPDSSPMSVAGQQMTARIYAFKKGKADTYRKNEGIIFTLNGQMHGRFTKDFFRRKRVGFSYLADSILVLLDCSSFSGRAREDLFINSRDRLSGGQLRGEIERALEDLLARHEGLLALRERRRREELASKLDESKPLEDILESLLKQSPTLSALFLRGRRLSTPFKTAKARAQEEQFEGKRCPTYFKFQGKPYGVELRRECHINMRCRVTFETDAVNEYFSRDVDPGEFSLFVVSAEGRLPVRDYTLNLQNGIATLTLELPSTSRVGKDVRFAATTTDGTRVEPFENVFLVKVKEAAVKPGGKKRKSRRKPPGEKAGDDREVPSGIQLPKIIEVYESPGSDDEMGWDDLTPPFDKYSALRVKHAGKSAENGQNAKGQDVYDFFLNADNVYAKAEMKPSHVDVQLTKARFRYGMVLLGLGVLHQEAQEKEPELSYSEDPFDDIRRPMNIEDKVEEFTKAVAPVLLPMIEHLGEALDLERATEDASGVSA